MLTRLEQQGAVLILRAIESFRPVERGADLEAIQQPTGLIGKCATYSPGGADAVVKLVAPEVEAAQIEIELGIAKKCRRIFQLFLKPWKKSRPGNPFFDEGPIHRRGNFID